MIKHYILSIKMIIKQSFKTHVYQTFRDKDNDSFFKVQLQLIEISNEKGKFLLFI